MQLILTLTACNSFNNIGAEVFRSSASLVHSLDLISVSIHPLFSLSEFLFPNKDAALLESITLVDDELQ